MNARSLRSALVLAFASAALVASAQTYRVTDLGTLGGNYSFGSALNASGRVAGGAETSPNVFRAFLSGPNGGPLKDLGTLGGNSSSAAGVNASGQVAGTADTAAGFGHAFLSAANGGVLKDLGTLGGDYSSGNAVNAAGQVAGIAYLRGGGTRAFVSGANGGALKDLGTLGSGNSYAFGINDAGQATGGSNDADGDIHAFLSGPDGGPLKDLGTLGGDYSSGDAVNGLGQVVGASRTAGGALHAFLSAPDGGALTDLGTLPYGGGFFGSAASEARSVNAAGAVVGDAYDSGDGGTTNHRAFLYTATDGLRDLNGLLDASGAGWTLQQASGISDAGLVTGYGTVDGNTHAFLLTPVPEPASLAALGLGVVAMLRRRKKVRKA